MRKNKKIIVSVILCAVLLLGSVIAIKAGTQLNSNATTTNSIKVHYYCAEGQPNIYYWNSLPTNISTQWPGVKMTSTGGNWYVYEFTNKDKINLIFNLNGNQSADLTRNSGEWWYKNGSWTSVDPDIIVPTNRTDFRDESIYFVITTRFFDGYKENNVHAWDDAQAKNPDTDPAWRGDFQGLIDKLDYIKAMGFSAIWVTPVVENSSGYDYHGYHAINFKKVDPRYESPGATYQDLINAIHAKGMKIIQDVVFNHTSNFGEEGLFPMFTKTGDLSKTSCLVKTDPNGVLPTNYDTLTPAAQYGKRIDAMKNAAGDPNNIYHHEKSLQWESYLEQTGQIAGDCVDLNTENPVVSKYLVDSYTQYINMGVDSFRVDTAKHISRLTWNKEFLPALTKAGGENFYIVGEVCARVRDVWNKGIPALSPAFFTWKESKEYAWGDRVTNEASTAQNYKDNMDGNTQPTTDNAFLKGNDYHTPDRSKFSGMNVIDFGMHWAFRSAPEAFGIARAEDQYINDSTWNVTYVDSHDYAPDQAPENQRFSGTQDTWAENLNLMFTFRGIPCIFYGSEIEFQKGKVIDVGPNAKLSDTGRAYYGDKIEGSVNVTDFAQYSGATGAMAETLNHPLAKHIQRLNLIRRAVPALRKGQYSTEGVSGNMAYKRRYTDAATNVDSFVCVALTDAATFTGIPSGTYVDAITGDTKQVGGSLTIPATGKGNMRVYVLQNSSTKTGKIGEAGLYLK